MLNIGQQLVLWLWISLVVLCLIYPPVVIGRRLATDSSFQAVTQEGWVYRPIWNKSGYAHQLFMIKEAEVDNFPASALASKALQWEATGEVV